MRALHSPICAGEGEIKKEAEDGLGDPSLRNCHLRFRLVRYGATVPGKLLEMRDRSGEICNKVAGLRAWWKSRDVWLTRREQGLVFFLLVLLTLGGMVKLLRESFGGQRLGAGLVEQPLHNPQVFERRGEH